MDNKKYFAGIDLGGTFIKAGLVGEKGNILIEKRIPTRVEKGSKVILEDICELMEVFQKDLPGEGSSGGVGIGAPGLIDVSNGIYLEGPNLPGWNEVPVVSGMSRRLNMPVILDNDANLAALGEHAFGAGKGCKDMMMITLGTGVGSGLIIHGELYRGARDTAGEFGHTTIHFDGPVCSCGRKGCIEAYVGTQGILRTLKQKLVLNKDSLLAEMDPGQITPKDISVAAEKGDKTAIEVLQYTGTYLGYGFGNVANLLNLERIVVGGGVSAAGDLILEPARQSCRRIAMKVPGETIKIVPAELGNKAGVIGAARLAMQNN